MLSLVPAAEEAYQMTIAFLIVPVFGIGILNLVPKSPLTGVAVLMA